MVKKTANPKHSEKRMKKDTLEEKNVSLGTNIQKRD
jgi:hypothetical protein